MTRSDENIPPVPTELQQTVRRLEEIVARLLLENEHQRRENERLRQQIHLQS